MERREFIFGLMAAPMALLTRNQISQSPGHYSMVLGATDANSLQISVVHRKDEALKFFIRLDSTGAISPSTQVQSKIREDSSWAASLVIFKDLPDYAPCTLLVEDQNQQIKDMRPIHWLDNRVQTPRVAVASCAAGYLYRPDIWLQLNESNPDLVIFLGDNIYGDRPNLVTKRPADPEQLWAQYVGARLRYDYFFRRELVPTIATWDDHDFGMDDGDRNFRFNLESQQTFNAFWPQNPDVSINLERGPGIATSLSAFDMEFILLDSRSDRASKHDQEIYTTTWGEAQKGWLYRKIRSSQKPLWIGNGQQFFGMHEKYTVENDFFLDFQWLVAVIRGSGRPVAFLSGDVHFSEITDVEESLFGFPTVEVTSSSLHSVTFPGQHNLRRNPRRRTATSRHNFILLDIQARGTLVEGKAKCIGINGEVAFEENIKFGL